MKKKILGGFFILAIAVTAFLNININSNDNILNNVSLSEVEALAVGLEQGEDGEEYVIGPSGSNWKEYWVQCQISSSVTYTISPSGFGISYGGAGASFNGGTSTSFGQTTVYNAKKLCCGFGLGLCMAAAGC